MRALRFGQNASENTQEIEIARSWRQGERIDLELVRSLSHPEISAPEKPGETRKAPAKIEDESVRIVLLQIGNEEIQQERLAGTGSPQNDAVGNVPMMKIEEVRRM